MLAATDRGQRTLIDVTYDIGLFTRYVIEGLAGGADLPPVGNGDGELDSAEIYAFTAAFVDLAARKTFGVLQRPVYSGAATSVLTSARTAPARSELRRTHASDPTSALSAGARRPDSWGSARKPLYKASRISYGTNGSGAIPLEGQH